jgi:hypothetical protein
MVRFGVTGYLFFNGESPDSGGFIWNGYHVHFSYSRLGLAVLLWAISILGVFRWLRYMDSKAFLTG